MNIFEFWTYLGRRGIDVSDGTKWSVADTKERRRIIQSEVRESEEDQRNAKAISICTQGATRRKITWQDMQKTEFNFGFLLARVYDLLPTPLNLKRWYKTEKDDCDRCKRRCVLEHVLSSCKTALTQGRYRWRPNKVLKALATILDPIEKHKNEQKHEGLSI